MEPQNLTAYFSACREKDYRLVSSYVSSQEIAAALIEKNLEPCYFKADEDKFQYQKAGWGGRMVLALPRALIYMIRAISCVAQAIFYSLSDKSGDQNYHWFRASTYLQQAKASFITFFRDRKGEYLMQGGLLQQQCYAHWMYPDAPTMFSGQKEDPAKAFAITLTEFKGMNEFQRLAVVRKYQLEGSLLAFTKIGALKPTLTVSEALNEFVDLLYKAADKERQAMTLKDLYDKSPRIITALKTDDQFALVTLGDLANTTTEDIPKIAERVNAIASKFPKTRKPIPKNMLDLPVVQFCQLSAAELDPRLDQIPVVFFALLPDQIVRDFNFSIMPPRCVEAFFSPTEQGRNRFKMLSQTQRGQLQNKLKWDRVKALFGIDDSETGRQRVAQLNVAELQTLLLWTVDPGTMDMLTDEQFVSLIPQDRAPIIPRETFQLSVYENSRTRPLRYFSKLFFGIASESDSPRKTDHKRCFALLNDSQVAFIVGTQTPSATDPWCEGWHYAMSLLSEDQKTQFRLRPEFETLEVTIRNKFL